MESTLPVMLKRCKNDQESMSEFNIDSVKLKLTVKD